MPAYRCLPREEGGAAAVAVVHPLLPPSKLNWLVLLDWNCLSPSTKKSATTVEYRQNTPQTQMCHILIETDWHYQDFRHLWVFHPASPACWIQWSVIGWNSVTCEEMPSGFIKNCRKTDKSMKMVKPFGTFSTRRHTVRPQTIVHIQRLSRTERGASLLLAGRIGRSYWSTGQTLDVSKLIREQISWILLFSGAQLRWFSSLRRRTIKSSAEIMKVM